MLFLINDTVLDLELGSIEPPPLPVPMSQLPVSWVEAMGRDLFSKTPDAHKTMPAAVTRLAFLLAMRVPDLNAALFVAPPQGCRPELVTVRYASVSSEIMSHLTAKYRAQALMPIEVDHYVWARAIAA
jgi:hypothetical protein